MMEIMSEFFTIGHSNHAIETFIGLLQQHAVTAIADVRSHPASRRFPDFDRKILQKSLHTAGIRYVFLGDALGARPRDPSCYSDRCADFDKMRQSEFFRVALARLQRGARDFRVCLLCAEKDPADCHRTWLVAQTLHEKGALVKHILADGGIEQHDALLNRVAGIDAGMESLFADNEEVLSAVARREGKRVAYREETIGEAGE